MATTYNISSPFLTKYLHFPWGGREIHIPKVFRGRGFKEITFQADIKENMRWRGDIVAIFEGLQGTTPFKLYKGEEIQGTTPFEPYKEREEIQGVQNLAQVLQFLKDAGAETINVEVVKPRFSGGSSQWGPSIQRIYIDSTVSGVAYSAQHFEEFPRRLHDKLIFGPRTLKQRVVNWLLKP